MILVLVALKVERQEVRRRLFGLRVEQHPAGTHFDVGTFRDTRVALALSGRGNHAAATIAERAISNYHPDAVLFVGVAGGLRDWVELGDVVVATKVYAYHGGRSEDGGFHAHPQAWPIPYEIDQIARHLVLDGRWAPEAERQPRVHFEPIAAGEVVINGREVTEVKRLRHFYADAIAVDMESAGAALAGHFNRSVPTAAVRSISDHAAGHKDRTDADGWQQTAAANAAMFALALAAKLDSHGDSTDSSAASTGRSSNTATTSGPNSPIIGQGGTITDGVFMDYRQGESQ